MPFDLKATVRLAQSREAGEIIGKAEYVEAPTAYLVRYVAADGRLVEQWWDESTLQWCNESTLQGAEA
jgi:hypothetical protein